MNQQSIDTLRLTKCTNPYDEIHAKQNKIKLQVKETDNAKTSELRSDKPHKDNQPRSRLLGEMTDKLMENSKSSLQIEVRTEDFAQ